MKTKLLCAFFLAQFVISFSFGQNSKVVIKVKWKEKSYENRLELYNAANDLVMTICDDTQCYTGTQLGGTDQYVVKYNLGCVNDGNNYYVKLFDIANDGWTNSTLNVIVAGTTVITNNGSGASSTGQTIYFNVSGGGAACSAEPDMDQDGVADYLDYDDDGDGLTDGAENLGEDRFECTLPPLVFENGAYEAASSSGAEGAVGAVYRFGNAIEGKDVLLEVVELDNTVISDIDVDTVDNPSYLQTQLTMTGTGTPGARFKFTIVDSGTTTPSAEVYRINGISWDVDGSSSYQESHVYYDVAAYGTENPTALEVTDLGGNNIQISANGEQEGPGFSNLKILRAYYQFIGNSFEMRMQLVNKTSTGSNLRQFGMSFTQCEFLDFNANSLIIITGEDFDGDGKYNHLDLDSDNDGIPDNIEAQSTLGYIAPSYDVNRNTGIDKNYGTGLTAIDTDGDNTPDVLDLDTDSDGIPDIQENGMANTIVSFSDGDDDGLDLLFEGSVGYDPTDVNDDINSPESSILPDTDGDLYTGGDLDYRDLFNTNPPASATLDFDGIDDYLTTPSFLNGRTELTLMAWVKADSGSTSDMVIAGENDACKLWLKNGNIPYFTVRLPGFPVRNVATGVLPFNEWHHMAGTYSATTGLLKIFIDGKLKGTYNFGTTGLGIVHSTLGNGAFEIGRLSSNLSNQNYFKGDIDEVRVFDSALTEELIQQMVYQEIEDNGGLIQGKILPKNIEDVKTFETLAWNHLIAYYPMTAIKNSTTSDYSGNNRTLKLRNITSVQHQTAPMPYRTGSDGNWTSTSTWLHGDVWDIEVVSKNKDWSIVDIKHNVTTSNSHTNLGLLIDNNKKLTVNGDQKIDNSWYLELNGTIDLQDDSQLIQGVFSDLVTSATGKILRRQEGNSSVYWYNYWSSPVGELGATALSDNNTSSNNTNNDDYKLNMLKKGDGSNVQFISNAYDEVGKVSTRWLYTYKNGVTYYDYESIDHNSAIEPGVGYTQKGTGTEDSHQQFIFEGKPNNGTILINVTDTGGSGSVPAVSKTDYLLGNPYASALDIHKFIDDNAGVIDGTLQLWQQWSGTSHNLDEYDGGYAQVNKMGSVRAYQFVGIEGDTNGNQDGTKTPTRYLPVGQGFMTEIVVNGTIEFNNSQRVFKKESDYNGSYGNGSIFFRTANGPEDDATPESDSEEQLMQKLRLEFSSVDGPATRRELLLGFSDFTSEAYDYGYDAKNVDDNANDLNLLMGEELMTMQAYGPITDDKEVPLALRASGAYNYRIRLTELKDIEEDQEIYLRDNLTGYYFDLRTDQAYEFSSEAGEFNSRFEIVFQSEESLSTQEQEYQYYLIYFSNDNDKLYAKDLKTDVDQLMVINILGQTVKELKDVRSQTLDNGLEISHLSAGTYVIYLKMGTHIETKKIIVN